jgi:putative ABC transport system permease protein
MFPRPDDDHPLPLRFRLSRHLIRLAGSLVPFEDRADWEAQWTAELMHRWQRREEVSRKRQFAARSLVLWSGGAFFHAWYLLRKEYTMDLIWQDVKFGLRALNRSRGLVAIAVLSLGIGIGANTAIFSAVDVFMLRPLPYPASDRLCTVWTINADRGWGQTSFTGPDFLDLKAQSRTMDVAAFRGGTYSLAGDFEAERLEGSYFSPEFFRVLGVQPVLGRGFLAEEGTPGHELVVVISDGLWKRRFGGDPDIIGTTILLDGISHTLVGVMPPHFWFWTPGQDIWTPLVVSGEESRASHNTAVLGRIRDGFGREQALGEARSIMEGISRTYPETSAGHSAMMLTLHEDVFNEGFQAGTLISTVAVALVLLIACANVANLLLTHAAGRSREVALRGVLGARRSRIVRQFLTEAVMVALLGGAVGLCLAVFGIRGLTALMPADFPMVYAIGLSGRVLFYTLVVTLLTGIIFGLAPALHSVRTNLADSLKEGGRTGSGTERGRLRKSLVVSEVALAQVLLISSVLLVQGFARIRLADLGFDRRDVLTLQTLLPEGQYTDAAAANDFYTRVQERLSALPGVETVGAATNLPIQGISGTYYVLEGQDFQDRELRGIVGFKYVLPRYFEAFDISLIRGRDIQDSDRAGTPPVVVINQALARRHWPDSDPIGRQIVIGSGPREIVGVTADTRDDRGDVEPIPMIFLPALQSRQLFMAWAIEASVPLHTLVEPVRAAVREVDPGVPAYNVMPMDDLIEQALGGDLIMARIMIALAVIALALALGGVYGVMAYSVAQRRRELGIRLSLGARRRDVLALVVRQGSGLALLGILIGTGVALGATRGLAQFLYGVSPFDPVTFSGVAVLLFLAGLAATWFPARQATRVDPAVALRLE